MKEKRERILDEDLVAMIAQVTERISEAAAKMDLDDADRAEINEKTERVRADLRRLEDFYENNRRN